MYARSSLTKLIAENQRASSVDEEDETANPATQVKNSERTWMLRHRMLEDSLVLAEQQGAIVTPGQGGSLLSVGLPWKWAMKDMTTPDPWSFIWYHSFNSTVLSCNEQPIIM